VKQEFSRTTTTAIRSKGLFAHEKTLKSLAGAIEAVRKPGQDRLELQRLRILVDLLQTYDSVLEKVEKWVEIANRIMELDKKLADFRTSRLDLMENRLSEIWAEAEEKRMQLSEDPVTPFGHVVGFNPVLLGSTKYILEGLLV